MVASSVGGLVAFELLAAEPQRVASMVTFGTPADLPGARHLANLDDPAGFDRDVRPFLDAASR